MIWELKVCPICDSALKVVNGSEEENLYLMKCPTMMEMPESHTRLLKGLYAHENVSSHFELEFQAQKAFHQVVRVYPYCVKSYIDVANIYLYNFKMYAEFVTETPPIDFPWKDKEKIIKKLSTYTLFS
jgi:hypothetical protein